MTGLVDEYFFGERSESMDRGFLGKKGASGLGGTHECFGVSTLDQYPCRYSGNRSTACY